MKKEDENVWPPRDMFPRRAAMFLRKLGEETMPMGKIKDLIHDFQQQLSYRSHEDMYPAEGYTDLERYLAYQLMPRDQELDELLKRRGEYWKKEADSSAKEARKERDLSLAVLCERDALKEQIRSLESQVQALRALIEVQEDKAAP